MAVPTKEYPLAAPVDVEKFMGFRLEFTGDGQPCQIHVTTSKRTMTLNPGNMGGDHTFQTLWARVVPTTVVLQALMDAIPDMTDEQRGVAVAAPETI